MAKCGSRSWGRRVLSIAVTAAAMVGFAVAPASAAPYDIYQYTSISNNITPDRCIDLPNGSSQNGVQMVVAACNGNVSQSFTYELDSTGGWGKLRNVATGKCLEIPGGDDGYSVKVQQNVCNATASKQKFQFESSHIRNKASNKCVAIDSTDPRLFQWGCTSDTRGYYQFWTPHPADTCTAPICTSPTAARPPR